MADAPAGSATVADDSAALAAAVQGVGAGGAPPAPAAGIAQAPPTAAAGSSSLPFAVAVPVGAIVGTLPNSKKRKVSLRPDGTRFEIDDDGIIRKIGVVPRPYQEPHPPIWVGGSSDAALRRTVRLADAWHPIRFTLDWMRDTGVLRLQEVADAEALGSAVEQLDVAA